MLDSEVSIPNYQLVRLDRDRHGGGIDLVFTTSPTTTKSCETIPPIGSSDHHGILATFTHNPGHPNIQVPRRTWRHKYADYEAANDMLLELDPSTITVDEDVNTSWNN